MYKHVLVAIDESDVSKQVLKEAIRFIDEHPKSFLRVIHVANENLPYLENQPTGLSKEFQQLIRKAGIELLEEVKKELQNNHVLKFETKLIEISTVNYKIAESIVEEVRAWHANLIMIGTHGRSGVHHFLLGSVAESVIRIAPVPVLLIRGK